MTEETPGVGHNVTGGVAGDILKAYLERIERLTEERKALNADIRDVFSEAKSNGFDPKIMRKVLRYRDMDPSARAEEIQLVGVYGRAVGIEDLL